MTADQYDCTAALLEETPDAVVVSNLGIASYVLHEVRARDRNLYLWGSMGATTATGLGVALGTDEPVTVVDGDGSIQMSLGVLATVGTVDPSNLVVVCFDNDVYGTTGGQETADVDLAAAAEACGVPAWDVADADSFTEAYADAVAHDGASFVSCAVEPADPDDRPSLDFPHVARRVRDALQ